MNFRESEIQMSCWPLIEEKEDERTRGREGKLNNLTSHSHLDEGVHFLLPQTMHFLAKRKTLWSGLIKRWVDQRERKHCKSQHQRNQLWSFQMKERKNHEK
jgi:hypothetical protein